MPVRLVQEDHVQIAVVVHLPTAELSQRKNHHFAGLPLAAVLALRLSVASRKSLKLVLGDLCEARLRNVRKRAGRGLHVLLPEDVAHADAKLLVVLEAVQDGIDVFGAAAEVGQALVHALPRRQHIAH